MTMIKSKFALVLGFSAIICACGTSAVAKQADVDIATKIQSSSNMRYFQDSLKRTDMLKMLEGKGPFTVFVPVDGAFSKVGLNRWTDLWAKPRTLKQVIGYGILKGDYNQKQLVDHGVPTLEGHSLQIKTSGSKRYIGKAHLKGEIKCSNGTIHLIDRLIYPPQLAASDTYTR